MDDQDQGYIGDDGEIHYRKRKPKLPFQPGNNTVLVVALIGAVAVIIATIIPVSTGKETKPFICNIIGSVLTVCSGSLLIDRQNINETQVALEQLQTAFAQTQTAVVQSLLATAPAHLLTNTLVPTPTVNWSAILDVSSGKLWQDTGISVEKGQHIRLEVVSGVWKKSPNAPYTHGEGSGYICGQSDCVEPMPKFPTDGLIGQIGDQLFFVGQGTTVVTEQSGTLSLRMNDGDHDVWDNNGDLSVGVAILN